MLTMPNILSLLFYHTKNRPVKDNFAEIINFVKFAQKNSPYLYDTDKGYFTVMSVTYFFSELFSLSFEKSIAFGMLSLNTVASIRIINTIPAPKIIATPSFT